MIIIDEAELDRHRGWRNCLWCGKNRYCEAAHVFARGMGGGGRLDIPYNLASLCHECHMESHAGREPTKITLMLLVAHRERVLQSDLEDEIHLLLRTPGEKPKKRKPRRTFG